ncbi:Putative flippase GtrA (transmembrane translocase of bactoprenol-linked glucose) [Amycolatopsis pretoriensis]|uniref:Putative flippase GtrA (Transmembrane translocase of bactoprenol-linked glucose) n=1 Tax=Amycolatopsis pretoriensis TaxID=218821 RepID=A0A1H5QLJ2_9PSEU|nr:GtrA family protein [Amycolatopsis pretoriensis]SEF26221.1 Putative flippase GtrA (transmembrane translocase of bactoprenol-linked glucose) [Amycolatopsis pretoriensis]
MPRELLRFAVVGLAAYGVTLLGDYSLKLTVFREKPVTALFCATVASTAFAYLLSRRWSFAGRGGHHRVREAALFFVVNAGAVAVNLVPPLVSRYVLHLSVPHVSFVAQEVADFVAGMVLGTLSGTAFRWYGYRRWVFPRSAPPVGVPQVGEPELVVERLARPRGAQRDGEIVEVP